MWLARVDSETIRPGPYRIDQVVPADDALAVLYQVGQQVENFGRGRNGLGRPGELPPLQVEHAVVKR